VLRHEQAAAAAATTVVAAVVNSPVQSLLEVAPQNT
jgi:hypothetical protein